MRLSFSSFSLLYIYTYIDGGIILVLIFTRFSFRHRCKIYYFVRVHLFIYIYIHLHTVALTFQIVSQIDLDERTQTDTPINGYTWPFHSNRDPIYRTVSLPLRESHLQGGCISVSDTSSHDMVQKHLY